MQADDKAPGRSHVPPTQKPEESRKRLWSFADLGREARLGPNRTIHGED
jgi:hypothetical protein